MMARGCSDSGAANVGENGWNPEDVRYRRKACRTLRGVPVLRPIRLHLQGHVRPRVLRRARLHRLDPQPVRLQLPAPYRGRPRLQVRAGLPVPCRGHLQVLPVRLQRQGQDHIHLPDRILAPNPALGRPVHILVRDPARVLVPSPVLAVGRAAEAAGLRGNRDHRRVVRRGTMACRSSRNDNGNMVANQLV